jgi:diaminopimelate epimerase
MAVDGEHCAVILGKEAKKWQVRLKMSDVPGYNSIHEDLIINTGSPHLVKFVRNTRELDVFSLGREARYSPAFTPGGTNVDFVEETAEGLFVRSYERGVEDETLSCGTGVTASVLAHATRAGMHSGRVVADTLGGRLYVSFERKGDGFAGIWLEGPAVLSFRGTILQDEKSF